MRTTDVKELRSAVESDDRGSSTDFTLVVDRPQQPEAIAGYDRVSRTPLLLAVTLAILAAATTAHGLVVATRRRRRDLAVLKAIGFTRRQVGAAVGWSATTVAGVALLAGLPLGVAGGRWAWAVLADRLGTPAVPVTPVVAALLAVPTTVVLANLVAWLPGRAARRIPPAIALRAE